MSQLWRFLRTGLELLFRHPLTGVNLIPILPDGRIALVQRHDTGQWAFPGGLIDWGETVTSAAHRELYEETGLKLNQIRQILGIYSNPDRDPRMHSICITLVVEVDGEFHIQDTDEIQTVQAWDCDAVYQLELAHDHNQQFQDFVAQDPLTKLR